MNFARKIVLSSVISISAIGLIACSDDSSTGASDKKNDSTTENAAIISAEGLASTDAGNIMRFKGRYKLDRTDPSNENSANLTFKNINFKVINSTKKEINAEISTNPSFVPSVNDIDLNSQLSVQVTVNLLDPAFDVCDDYSLVVKVIASDGQNDFFRQDTIAFAPSAKENIFCKNIDLSSSSSTEPLINEITMIPCEVKIETKNNEGISLATCTAVPAATADIAFTTSSTGDQELIANAGAEISFVTLANSSYNANAWPEDINSRTAYVSDFNLGTSETSSLSLSIEDESIYVAKTAAYNATTGAGFYPFAIFKSSFPDENGNYTIFVKIYKIQ